MNLTKRQIERQINRAKKTLILLGFELKGGRYELNFEADVRNSKLGYQIIVCHKDNSWFIKIWDKDDPKDYADRISGTTSFSSNFGGIERIFSIIIRAYALSRVCVHNDELKSHYKSQIKKIMDDLNSIY